MATGPLNRAMLHEIFPRVDFAFFGNYVNRYRRQLLQKKQPTVDLILAVENSVEFHEMNIIKNKQHYTYFARSTSGKVVHKIHEMGARMHFNHMSLTDCEHTKELSNGEQSKVQIRYGVIDLRDMLRDLQHWETLLSSSFMQRPFEVLEEGPSYDQVQEMQRKNLTSALAYAAMTTPTGSSEQELYRTIVRIPHYQEKRVSYFFDKEDEATVVDDSLDRFQAMYAPIAEQFKDVMEIKDGKFLIDAEDKGTQKLLYMAVNDNIHKNLEGFSVALFDKELQWNKDEFSVAEKERFVDKLIEKDLKTQEKLVHEATDRVLLAHRNLKMLLFCTSGPFFACMYGFKQVLKLLVLYFVYNKSGVKKGIQKQTEATPASSDGKLATAAPESSPQQ